MSKEVGARIRETRQKAGLSQAALAAKTEGISASVLSKAERGEKELSPEQLQALAAALFALYVVMCRKYVGGGRLAR